jgi:NAD(P)-dependent dehydrogenase (short-subunit alcohol dehydrogenase family)
MIAGSPHASVSKTGVKRCPVTLVTGAGSGLGLETAMHLAGEGYRVVGSVLDERERAVLVAEAARRNVCVGVVAMDLTNEEAVHRTVREVVEAEGGIDALVHFAGMGLRGFFEDLSLDEVRRVFDVNVFGTMAVTQAVVPYMRQAGHGRIVLTTSVGGRMGSMSISGYASSKFAVEGLGDCIRQELYPFNIYVTLLEPGLVRTPHFTVNRNRARRAVLPSSVYFPWFCQHEHLVDNILANNSFGAREVAATVDRILATRRPRLRYVVGGKAKWILRLRRYLPGELFESMYWAIVRKVVTRPRKPVLTLSGTDAS